MTPMLQAQDESHGSACCINSKLLLQTADGRKGVPLAVVGSGLGGDCAPKAANFR